MPAFGKGSLKKLNTCHSDIQLICYAAIQMLDFSIITGHRTKEEQNALYPKFTKLKWPDGNHNSFPSNAIDMAPYIPPFGAIFGSQKQKLEIQAYMITQGKSLSLAKINDFVIKSYARMIGHVEAVAFQNGIDIRVGIDWDGDFNMLDQTFHDLGHWELK